jgi:hypothetical protein
MKQSHLLVEWKCEKFLAPKYLAADSDQFATAQPVLCLSDICLSHGSSHGSSLAWTKTCLQYSACRVILRQRVIRMRPNNPIIQYHVPEYAKADYIGDARALAVVQWLNARPQVKGKADPVEQLIELNRKWKPGADVNAVTSKVRDILKNSQLCLTPYWYVPVIHAMRLVVDKGRARRRGHPIQPVVITDWRRWGVDWDATAKGMSRDQALALRGVLDLAAGGDLGGLKRCERESCGLWFFAAKRTKKRFHSEDCQRSMLRDTDEWRDQHAAEMRRRRAKKSKRRRRGKR